MSKKFQTDNSHGKIGVAGGKVSATSGWKKWVLGVCAVAGLAHAVDYATTPPSLDLHSAHSVESQNANQDVRNALVSVVSYDVDRAGNISDIHTGAGVVIHDSGTKASTYKGNTLNAILTSSQNLRDIHNGQKPGLERKYAIMHGNHVIGIGHVLTDGRSFGDERTNDVATLAVEPISAGAAMEYTGIYGAKLAPEILDHSMRIDFPKPVNGAEIASGSPILDADGRVVAVYSAPGDYKSLQNIYGSDISKKGLNTDNLSSFLRSPGTLDGIQKAEHANWNGMVTHAYVAELNTIASDASSPDNHNPHGLDPKYVLNGLGHAGRSVSVAGYDSGANHPGAKVTILSPDEHGVKAFNGTMSPVTGYVMEQEKKAASPSIPTP